ncbi:MAG: RluA family pseudouridine synthase [Bacteroidetes bacterium]|nr:MAG: RluA family pseudouridine synthase [Bacteroidota bacterium]
MAISEIEKEDFSAETNQEDELFLHKTIVADKGQTLLRIDKFLIDRLPNASRNRIQNAIDNHSILVNDKPTKANYRVRPLDAISVFLPNPPRNDEILPENIPLDIIYEDHDLLLVNKKPGMVVHPAYGNWNGTLVNALVHHFEHLPTSKNGKIRPGLVHRIDKDTSGLLIIAKTEHAMTHLAAQFFHHTIERTYFALIWGIPKVLKGTIKTYLGRSLLDRRITANYDDSEKGKIAITHYEVLQTFDVVSLIKCNLETGRTHQIRAHMKYLGHPIFSDATYGGDKILKGTQSGKYKLFIQQCFETIPRQSLHAKTLGFIHPTTKKTMQFDSELPEDFKNVLQKFEKFVDEGK